MRERSVVGTKYGDSRHAVHDELHLFVDSRTYYNAKGRYATWSFRLKKG
jgi:hypothetical protein